MRLGKMALYIENNSFSVKFERNDVISWPVIVVRHVRSFMAVIAGNNCGVEVWTSEWQTSIKAKVYSNPNEMLHSQYLIT